MLVKGATVSKGGPWGLQRQLFSSSKAVKLITRAAMEWMISLSTLCIELPYVVWAQQFVPDVKFINSGPSSAYFSMISSAQCKGLSSRERQYSFCFPCIPLAVVYIHIASIKISPDSTTRYPRESYVWPHPLGPLHICFVIIVPICPFHRHLQCPCPWNS